MATKRLSGTRHNHLKGKMKARNSLLAVAAMVIVCGCGGGGSDGGATGNAPIPAPTPTPTPTPTPPPPPTPSTITNPLTGLAAPGSPTKTLAGSAYAGAVVTAYSVKSDGTSGPVIAGPVTSSLDGFTLNFSDAPTAWVRLVAVGGTKERRTDASIQGGGTMQLVTPFVTTSQNNLKITAMSDIAANVMISNVKKGMTLPDAFSAGMRTLLQMDSANVLLLQDTSVYLNVLKGAIKSDLKYYDAQSPQASELQDGLDLLAVMLDLPSKDVTRVVGDSGQSNYALSGVNGAGAAINVGAWVGTTFDPAAPQTLKELMATKIPEAQKVTDASTGLKVGPRIVDYMSRYMIQDFIVDTACRSGASVYLLSRYPFYALDSQNRIPAADCTAAAARMRELNNRLSTNKSTGK